MVTCEPEWEPALARMSMTTGPDDDAGVTTAVGGEMQEQAMLTVQPNLYFGVRTQFIKLIMLYYVF